MPIYTFETESGKRVELFMAMDEAPTIGSIVTIGKASLKRLADRVQVDARPEKHFTSRSLPRWDPNAPRHNAGGQPQFASDKEVREYVAKNEGDWIYD